MKYVKTFENHNNSTLIIVDVQKSFKKFFTDMYINELKKYCKNFKNVFQIWDNHIDGKNVDKDYLYDKKPDIPVHNDLYTFPNQVELKEITNTFIQHHIVRFKDYPRTCKAFSNILFSYILD